MLIIVTLEFLCRGKTRARRVEGWEMAQWEEASSCHVWVWPKYQLRDVPIFKLLLLLLSHRKRRHVQGDESICQLKINLEEEKKILSFHFRRHMMMRTSETCRLLSALFLLVSFHFQMLSASFFHFYCHHRVFRFNLSPGWLNAMLAIFAFRKTAFLFFRECHEFVYGDERASNFSWQMNNESWKRRLNLEFFCCSVWLGFHDDDHLDIS